MATRAKIIVKHTDGKYYAIYNHADGYPSHLFEVLNNHYSSQELAEKLVSLGNASFIDQSIECPEGHTFENRIEGYSVFYGRDRGEKDAEALSGELIEILHEDFGEEYIYLWDGEKWTIR